MTEASHYIQCALYIQRIKTQPVKVDRGGDCVTDVTCGFGKMYKQGFFLDAFLTNQLNWSWRFLSFSEILLEFFQNFSLSFSQFSSVFLNFVLFLLNPENKEFLNVIKLVMSRIY